MNGKLFHSFLIVVIHSGIIVSNSVAAEIIHEDGTTCSLPNLPTARQHHVQCGLTACGGSSSAAGTTCNTFTDGSWTTSHNLAAKRMYSVCWNSPDGILLFGSHPNDKRTTELLSTSTSSPLSYATSLHKPLATSSNATNNPTIKPL